jgi:HYR domain-containing protein
LRLNLNTSALLALLMLALAVPPVTAQMGGCPSITPHLSITSGGADVHVGDCVTLQLLVVRNNGHTTTTTDVTNDPNTRFFTDPPQGHFTSKNVLCATAADCDKAFTIFGVYFDPCTLANQTASVSLHVLPCQPAPLSLICPVSIPGVSNEAGLCGAHVSFANPTAAGGTPPIQVSCSPSSGSFFSVGTTTVNCTAADSAGQMAHCSFQVTVQDTQSPTITCPDNITVQAAPGSSSATVTVPPAMVSDNCPGAGFAGFRSDGQPLDARYPLGTTTITWMAADAHGNFNSCIQTVAVTPVQPLIIVGQPVAVSNLRLEIFGVDVVDLDNDSSAVFHVGADGSVYVRDYAGTALVRLPPNGGPGDILLDTTHEDSSARGDSTDGVGLSRLLGAQANNDDVMGVLALRADNTLGVYHLDKSGRLNQLGIVPDVTSPGQFAMSDHDQLAYVAANASGVLTLFQTTGGQPAAVLSAGQAVNGATVVGISDLTSNDAGDLAFLVILRRADGTQAEAVLRKTSAGLDVIAMTGQVVDEAHGAGATGALTQLLRPRIGPDSTVVFAGVGDGFVNFYAARPGHPLQPLLPGADWNADPSTFSADIAADGGIALRAAAGGSTASMLYLITPAGDVSLVAGARRDIQPLGRPAFVPGGTESLFFFLGQNLDLPLDRNNNPLVGLFRSRLVNGGSVVEPVALPGQLVPNIPALPANSTTDLIGLTQRPVVTANTLTFGLWYGVQDKNSPLSSIDDLRTLPVPAAVIFQIPLLGTLADGHPVAPEGAVVSGTAKLAQLRALSFRADHTLDTLALLPGAGPVIVPTAPSAGIAGVARTQALPQATLQPVLATGDPLGLGASESLEYVLPPLLALGTNQQLFVARFQEAGAGREGYFTLGPGTQHVQPVKSPIAATSMGATADTLFNHFSYANTSPMRDLNILDPPAIFSDASGLNVVFKALLNGKPGTSLMTTVLSGVFEWNGSNAVNAVGLSTGPTPLTLEHWAAGKAGAVYLQARDASRSHLYRSAAPGAALQLITAAEALADLNNFVLSSDGATLYVYAKDQSRAAGLFRVDPAQNSPMPLVTTVGRVLQGQPVPPALDGSNVSGLTFSGDFTLDTALARGRLYFYATLQAGGSNSKRGLFLLDPSGQSASLLLVGALAESSARTVTQIAFPPAGAVSNTRSTLAYPYQIGTRWAIGRTRNGTPQLIAQEGPSGFAVLDASLLLSTPDHPFAPGPVFALGEDDAVAFLASDGKRWGLYRVR